MSSHSHAHTPRAIPATAVREVLAQPVSIQSLAVFRILFGALLAWDVRRSSSTTASGAIT